MTDEERIKVENVTMRVALDLWDKDLMNRLADKIRTDALSQFRPVIEGLVLAAKHLALATPDKRLRSELERYVKLGEEKLKSPLLGPPTYPDKQKLREDQRVFQETEQALYREAMRHDQTKEELARVNKEADACMKAIETLGQRIVLAVEKVSRAAPLNFDEALTYIAILGEERDKAVARAGAMVQTESYEVGYARGRADLKRTEDLVSHHALDCVHTRKLKDGTRDPKYSDIFSLSDEDSYDCCTCLKNFVSDYRYNNLLTLASGAMTLLLDAGDASVAGMHEKWKESKNRLLALFESFGFAKERATRKANLPEKTR